MMLLRANVLARGHSGIRAATIDALIALLNARRASGGPEPRIGRRQRRPRAARPPQPRPHRRRRSDRGPRARGAGREGAGSAGLTPVRLGPKEGLALINGTQASVGRAGAGASSGPSARPRRRRRGGAVDRRARGSSRPFEARIHEARPHPGQAVSAANIARLLAGKRHQRFARQLRPRPGRLFGTLRGAGPRRRARRARAMRAHDRRNRSQRVHRQPDGVRRHRRDRLGRQLPRRAGRDRRRSASPSC